MPKQKLNNGTWVIFKNIVATMSGKIVDSKQYTNHIKYFIHAVDPTGCVSTYEVADKDVKVLPKFDAVRSKEEIIFDFFATYAGNVEGSLTDMTTEEALSHLGSFNPEDNMDEDEREKASPDNPHNYSPSDIFIGVASAATGIPEYEFLYAAPAMLALIKQQKAA